METINTLGRRKKSVARLYIKKGKGNILVNKRDYKDYFPTGVLQNKVTQPMDILECSGKYDLKVNVAGGGITGQAEAVRLAVARAMVKEDAENKSPLRQAGLMTRDPRMVERKKFGQKKARKKFQFSKR